MIKYICDFQNCEKEAHYPAGKDWTDQEMFDVRDIAGFPYFWFRVGIAGKTFCPEHTKVAMNALITLIKKKYELGTTNL